MDDPTQAGTPIPIKVGSGVNPSWTAPTTNQPVDQQAVAPPASSVSPQPLPHVAIPAPAVGPVTPLPVTPTHTETPVTSTMAIPELQPTPDLVQPTAPAGSQPSAQPVAIPQSTPQADAHVSFPSVAGGEAEASQQVSADPELAVDESDEQPRPSRPKYVKPLLISAVILLVALGAAGFLWSQGILFGLPSDAKHAHLKMLAAMKTQTSYHYEGKIGFVLNQEDDGVVTTQASAETTVIENFLGSLTALADETEVYSTGITPKCLPDEEPAEEIIEASQPSASLACVQPDPASVPGLDEPISFNLDFTGDRAGATNSQTSLTVDVSSLAGLLPTTVPNSIRLDTRLVDGTIYLRLPILSLITGSEKNQWFAFDEADLADLQSKPMTELTTAQLSAMVKSGKRLGFEQIGQQKTAHYQMELDPVAMVEAFDAGATSGEAGDLLRTVKLTVDTWLGVRDALPYQMTATAKFLYEQKIHQLNFSLTVGSYGKADAVVAPDPSEVNRNGLSDILNGDLSNFEVKAQDVQRKADIDSLAQALELYKADHGRYLQTGEAVIKTNDRASILKELTIGGYLKELPVDPLDPTYWYGYASPDGTTFEVWSILEDTTDPDASQRGDYTVYRMVNTKPITGTPLPFFTPVASPVVSVLPATSATPTATPTSTTRSPNR